jgi:hypothetical protein
LCRRNWSVSKTIRCCVNCYQIMRLSNKSPKLKIIPIEV